MINHLKQELKALREKYWGRRTMVNCVALLHTKAVHGKAEIMDTHSYQEAMCEANRAVVNYGLACINDHTLGERIYYRTQADRQFEHANNLLREAYGRDK